jgi:hypothetical protein
MPIQAVFATKENPSTSISLNSRWRPDRADLRSIGANLVPIKAIQARFEAVQITSGCTS